MQSSVLCQFFSCCGVHDTRAGCEDEASSLIPLSECPLHLQTASNAWSSIRLDVNQTSRDVGRSAKGKVGRGRQANKIIIIAQERCGGASWKTNGVEATVRNFLELGADREMFELSIVSFWH